MSIPLVGESNPTLSGMTMENERSGDMIESDTIKLLRECCAGIQMGVASIEEVLPKVKNHALKTDLERCKTEHDKLGTETRKMRQS